LEYPVLVRTATSSPAGIATVGFVAVLTISILPARVAGVQPAAPRFRSAVQVVAVSAVVRDRKGRFVRDLTREDFEVFDRGVRRSIADFRTGASAPVSVAILFDTSGSMQMASKLAAARQAAAHLVAALDQDPIQGPIDEAAVFVFDKTLREIQPFTTDRAAIERALSSISPYGETSIFDAITEAADRVMARGAARRALVVITDAIDTASRHTATEAAIAASAVDIPVYIIAVVPPIDHPGAPDAVRAERVNGDEDELRRLAERTGGAGFVASVPAHASIAARQIVAELRHQYLLAFEAGAEPGWHPVDVKTRDRDLRVRARTGYFVGRPGGVSGHVEP
jgi:Ca-activated chloride channel family protein